jgi:hypothetical protein
MKNKYLTVGMLIELLSRQDRDLPVLIARNVEYESYITAEDMKVYTDKYGHKELHIGDVG